MDRLKHPCQIPTALTLAMLTGACYSPTFPPGLLCTAGTRECPGEQICAIDNRCYDDVIWPYRKAITVKGRSEAVTDFTLAIFSDRDPDLVGQLGDDFRLQTDTGDVVPFELESFNSKTGAFALWTRINLGTADQTLYLYYKGLPQSQSQSQSSIWPANARDRAVWHGTVEGNKVIDSTQNHLDATPPPPPPKQAPKQAPEKAPAMAPGIVGQALELNTESPRLTLAETNLDKIRFGTDSFSYSVWVKVTTPNNADDEPWAFGGTSSSQAGYKLELGRGKWRAQVADGTDDPRVDFGQFKSFKDQWTQLVAVVDRSMSSSPKLDIYANGTVVSSNNLSPLENLSPAAKTQAYIGGGDSNPFVGLIDELRITQGTLSAAEIKAQYDNFTNTNSSFFTIGKQEEQEEN